MKKTGVLVLVLLLILLIVISSYFVYAVIPASECDTNFPDSDGELCYTNSYTGRCIEYSSNL